MTTNKQAASEYEAVRRASEPAYPCGDGLRPYNYGLTKRELFAMAAMGALASIPFDGGTLGYDELPRQDALRAVQYADALIAELARGEYHG